VDVVIWQHNVASMTSIVCHKVLHLSESLHHDGLKGVGCPNKTFFKSSQVSPYRKFPYDQSIPHKKFQII